MSIYNYVVSAQKPTATNAAATGAFTGPDDLNLLVAKYNSIEVYLVTSEGLRLVHEVGLYARVATIHLFRAQGQTQDWLLVCTERQQFAILSYNTVARKIATEAAGTTRNDVGRPTPNGQISGVDPDGRMIFVHQYVGMIKIIPLDKNGRVQEAFNVRLDELNVVSIQFLHSCPRPTIAVLFQDTKDARHLKTYEINTTDKSLVDGPWSLPNVTSDNLLIPMPKRLGGVVAIGSRSITYLGPSATVSISMAPCEIVAHGLVDAEARQVLLGDAKGNLYVLNLRHVNNITLQKLGEISRPSCLAYLDNGVVYVGSRAGDSQLIRLREEPMDDNVYVEVLELYTNIGPMLDFCVMDLERQGQGQMVTCSGYGKDGSLRIVRSGVGITEAASIELPGIKGIWTLRSDANAPSFDTMFAVSFIGQTRFLVFHGDEPIDVEVPGFSTEEQTLCCANMTNDLMIQVTPTRVNVVDRIQRVHVSSWTPPGNISISIASVAPSQLLLAMSGGHVIYLEVEGKQLVERRSTKLPSEISCINAGLLGTSDRLNVCAIGLWTDMSVRLLKLPDLTELAAEMLGGEYIPRSVSLTTFSKHSYMLVGLGDGQLYTFVIDPATGTLSDRKKIAVGTQPMALNTFTTNKTSHVFAASDRPTIIYESNGKLVFSNLNVKDVNFMVPFHSDAFPDSIAVAGDAGLTIGAIDGVQKLHIQTIMLGEEPRRIAYQESTLTLAVLTLSQSNEDSMSDCSETGSIRLLDSQTFEFIDTIRLDANEQGLSIASLSFNGNTEPYYVVGTARTLPNEDYPTQGHIRVYEVGEGRRLKQVAVADVGGAVFSLAPLCGRLAAGINSSLVVFKWAEAARGVFELTKECSSHSFVMALSVKTRGDFVVVSDLLKSVMMFRYNVTDNTLEEVARDFSALWTTCVDILDDDTVIVSDNEYNLSTLRKNVDSMVPDDSKKMELAGLFHFGDLINQIRQGSLVMKSPDHELHDAPTMLFGTVSGAIGVIASISQEKYNFMKRVQDNLVRIVRGVGGFDHNQWRNFNSENRSPEWFNYLDGDVIELFLELDAVHKEAVIRGEQGGQALNVTAEELTRAIDELARLH